MSQTIKKNYSSVKKLLLFKNWNKDTKGVSPFNFEHGFWHRTFFDNYVNTLFEKAESLVSKGFVVVQDFVPESGFYSFVRNNSKRLFLPDDFSDYRDDKELVNELFHKTPVPIVDSYSSIIIDLLKQFLLEVTEKFVDREDVSEFNFLHCKEFDFDYVLNFHLKSYPHTILTPLSSFYYNSLLQCLFVDKNVIFSFNDDLKVFDDVINSGSCCKFLLRVNGSGEDVFIATKFRHSCTEKDKEGNVCGDVVEFSNIHKSNKLACSLGHTIKSFSNIPVVESVPFINYNAEIVNEDGDVVRDVQVYSHQKLLFDTVWVNGFLTEVGGFPSLVVVSQKYDVDNGLVVLPDDLFVKEPVNCVVAGGVVNDWLECVVDGLNRYMKLFHDVNVTRSNRVVGLFNVLLVLCNELWDEKFMSLVAGQSSSGKSFLTTLYGRLLSNSCKVFKGSQITPVRLLGGRSNKKSVFKNGVYEPGAVESQRVVVLDESTEALDNFNNPLLGQSLERNLFHNLKDAFGDSDRGTQDSREVKPRASIFLLGNIEQLRYSKTNYVKSFNRRFRKFSKGSEANPRVPLFKPVEWYEEFLGEEGVFYGKSHAVVRYNDYNVHNPVTFLPEAEFSRFTVFIVLINDFVKSFEPRVRTGSVAGLSFHREELRRSLLSSLGVDSRSDVNTVPGPSNDLFDAVWVEFQSFLVSERNNFLFHRASSSLNGHVLNNVSRLLTFLLHGNHLFFGEVFVPEKGLSVNDKLLLRKYCLLNFNCLSDEEASLSRKPLVNDIFYALDELDSEVSFLTKEFLGKKQREKDFKKGVVVDFGDGDQEDGDDALLEEQLTSLLNLDGVDK